jgi:hypothetical protein
MSTKKRQRFTDAGDVDLDREVVRRDDGTRITEAEAAAQGEAIAARLRGRPSLTGHRAHSPQVTTRLPQALRDKLGERAQREGRRPSEIVREALEQYLRDAR